MSTTPRPWNVNFYPSPTIGTTKGAYADITTANGYKVVSILREWGQPNHVVQANADLIVRAVNERDQQLEVLQAALEFLENGTPIHPGSDVHHQIAEALKGQVLRVSVTTQKGITEREGVARGLDQ